MNPLGWKIVPLPPSENYVHTLDGNPPPGLPGYLVQDQHGIYWPGVILVLTVWVLCALFAVPIYRRLP